MFLFHFFNAFLILFFAGPSLAQEVEVEDHSSSPLCKTFYQRACQGAWPHHDPTGHVDYAIRGEVKALRLLDQIVKSSSNLSVSDLNEALAERVYSKDKRARLQEVYEQVLNELIALLQENTGPGFTPELSRFLQARLKRVVFELPSPASVYSDDVDIFTRNSLYYERTPEGLMRIRVGGAFVLGVTSLYNLTFSIAHELAHAIDPCELNLMRIKSPAYTEYKQCFLSKSWIEQEDMDCRKNGQLAEVFADWVATHISARLMPDRLEKMPLADKEASIINSVRDLCDQGNASGALNFENHPGPELRIGSIYGQHPRIRNQLRCEAQPTEVEYCPFILNEDI